MKRVLIVLSVAATTALWATAAAPVASVTSSTAFDLHGNHVNVDGVPSWPVMAGDDIATQSGQAVIQLRDGSRVELLGNSHAQVESKDGSLLLRLLSGAMRILTLGPPAAGTQIYTQSTLAKPVVGQMVSIGAVPVIGAQGGPVMQSFALPKPVSRK